MYYIPAFVESFLSQFRTGDYVGVFNPLHDVDMNVNGGELIEVCAVLEKYEGYIPKFNPFGLRAKEPIFIIQNILTNETRNILTDDYITYNEYHYCNPARHYGFDNHVQYNTALEFEYRKIDKADVVQFLNDYHEKKEREDEKKRKSEEEERRKQLEQEQAQKERKALNDSITNPDIQVLINKVMK